MESFVRLLKPNDDDPSKWPEWEFGSKWKSENNKKTKCKPKALCLENPLVAIISITKYDGENAMPFCNLPGVAADLQKNVNLWNGYFQYETNILTDTIFNEKVQQEHQHVFTEEKEEDKEEEESNSDDHQNNVQISDEEIELNEQKEEMKLNLLDNDSDNIVLKRVTLKDVNTFLDKTRRNMTDYNHDALICILGGHGGNDCLVTADKKHKKISHIEDYFSSKAQPQISNMPKIIIVDLCRGTTLPETVSSPSSTWKRTRSVQEPVIHPQAEISVLYSNTAGYAVPENDEGSVMIGCLSDIIRDTDLCVHDFNNITTMLAEQVAEKSAGLLCTEFISRNKYLMYFKRGKGGRIHKYPKMKSELINIGANVNEINEQHEDFSTLIRLFIIDCSMVLLTQSVLCVFAYTAAESKDKIIKLLSV